MAEHDLFPSYGQTRYSSEFALHLNTVPTRRFEPSTGVHGFGGYTSWNGDPIEADDMWGALYTACSLLFGATITIIDTTIFDIPTLGDPPQPVSLIPYTALVGADGTPGWYQAVQALFTFYDTAFNTGKFTLLDAASNNNFARRVSSTVSADEQGVIDVLTSPDWAFASRAGFRLSSLRSLQWGVNDELKKQYPGI